jgi:hypothetical protein
VRKSGLAALIKEREDKFKALQQDKRDRTMLIPKGNEGRARRLEEVTQAAEQKRQLVERAQRRLQTISHLELDVADFRNRRAPDLLSEMQQERQDTGLSPEDWNQFKVDFVGDVDSLLQARKSDARALVRAIAGPGRLRSCGASRR